MKNPLPLSHPCMLIVGKPTQTNEYTIHAIKSFFCVEKKNTPPFCRCNACHKISKQQHESILFIAPTSTYTIDDIAIISERTRFALDPSQQFFIILYAAHLLTQATANRLLKILEEPPPGYYFFLLTTNPDQLLPTIISRCAIIDLAIGNNTNTLLEIHDLTQHQLLSFFLLQNKRTDHIGFETILKKLDLNESESTTLAESLMLFISNKIHTYRMQQKQYTTLTTLHAMRDFLQQALKTPPQNGSATIFWKYLFLKMPLPPIQIIWT